MRLVRCSPPPFLEGVEWKADHVVWAWCVGVGVGGFWDSRRVPSPSQSESEVERINVATLCGLPAPSSGLVLKHYHYPFPFSTQAMVHIGPM
jgi:hypothetical protein